MFQVKLDESTTARRRIPVLLVDATDGYTPKTGLSTFTVTVSQNGTILSSQSQTVTEVGNGIYYYTLGTGAVNTLGWVTINVYATACRNYNAIVQIMAYDAMDATGLGLSRIDQTIGSRMATFTLPTNFSSLAINGSGAVTVSTVSDKTGYSLTQAFPTNFSSLSISGVGAVTAGTVSDKTGYSLTQVFPTNFSTLSISGAGAVTAGTVGDKTGYSLATTPPTATQITDAVWSANIDTNSSNTNWGNSTMGQRVLRANASNSSVKVVGSGAGHIAADVHELQPGVIVDADFGAGTVYEKLGTLIEADTPTGFRYTAQALEQAPTGGAGSTTTYVTGNVPYALRSDQQFPQGTIELLVGSLLRLDLQVLDADGVPINLTGATVTVGLRNASTNAVVGTDQSATLSFARMGFVYVDTVSAWTNTAGLYRLTISATIGSDVIVAGPMPFVVNAR